MITVSSISLSSHVKTPPLPEHSHVIVCFTHITQLERVLFVNVEEDNFTACFCVFSRL